MTLIPAILISMIILVILLPFAFRMITTRTMVSFGKTLIIASGVLLIQQSIKSEVFALAGLLLFILGLGISISALFRREKE